jgi:cytochrome c biogenesis protein CcdA/thiol-disulfide isomerase/thioredoxin
MLLLALFALLAGAATAVSPCVLPVLPALLAAGAAGGRRRPLGIVIGLAVTFTLTIVGLASVLHGVGIGDSTTRDVAIAVIGAAGVVMLVPALAARLEAPLSRLARFGPSTAGDGFWSGLGVGAALGFVYVPCAGPILSAVIAVGSVSGRTLLIGAAYAIGSSAVLLVLSLTGRRLLAPLRRGNRVAGLQRGIGAVMVATAVLMAFQLDVRLENSIARNIPDVNLANGLEKSGAVQKRLDDLRGRSRFAAATRSSASGTTSKRLPDYGPAPDFTGTQRWFNTPGGRPLTLAGLRGHVVLVDFWTYTCINCIRTLPYLKAWYAKYHADGLVIVGVHSPEFSFEKDAGNVAMAIRDDGLKYPVVQDNDLKTWQAWSNQAWPAEYLIDARGHVRHGQLGEGDYAGSEQAIRSLLAEAGAQHLGGMSRPRGAITPSQQTTPETYVGTARAERFVGAPLHGTHLYSGPPPGRLALSHFALDGIWTIGQQAARAGTGAVLSAKIQARDVYVVLSPPAHGPGRVRVSVDGGLPRTLVVRSQRLYTLAHFARLSTHTIALRPEAGVRAYSFTFG